MTSIAELLSRYDRPGPRYTSYPPATEFHEGVDADTYAAHLARAAGSEEPISFYVHLPFCEERCLFCGCNVVITKQRDVARRYMQALYAELRDVATRLGERRSLRQFHLGGGTPTYHSPEGLRELVEVVTSEFSVEPDAECAVEVDPRVTTEEHLACLAELGFNRLSLGVQDFTPEVQEAVLRIQSFEATRDLVARARQLGFTSVNIDLIYGLPLQRVETFRATLEQLIEIRPERVAVYSFAHIPWIKGQQRSIDPQDLPEPRVKLELFSSAIELLRGAGYISVGMDHFALPEDEMGRAARDGSLWRNFMGYTVRHAPDMVAVGMSGISDVAGGFFQNEKKLIDYERAIEGGRLPVTRGYVLSGDDPLRRHVITSLMCTFRVDVPEVERRFGIDFWQTFAAERDQLAQLVADGFVELGPRRLEVLGDGRLFVRNVCLLFDAHRKADEGGQRFSRTV